MSTETSRIRVSGIVVDVIRKDIKNLHLAVYPPSGRVRVAAPLGVNNEAVRIAVVTRLPWIRRQQAKFTGQDRQAAREYVAGESHYFLGQRYRLNVVIRPGSSQVTICNSRTISLSVREGSDWAHREKVFVAWYRQQLKALILPLIEKWKPVIGVEVAEWGVRRMKTKWGTCNAQARRVLLNLELAKKPLPCIEYIVVHEMVHILERHHDDRFRTLMDKFLPQWRLRREELNHAPLGHEKWGY